MVRAIYWLHDGQVRHEHGGAWARRRAAPQGHRRQRTVAPHHDRDRRDQEPARGRRHHAQVAHAGYTRRRRLSDIYEAAKSFTGQFLIDDTFLAGEGVTDFDAYRVDPSQPLSLDFFVPDSSKPPPGVSLAAKA